MKKTVLTLNLAPARVTDSSVKKELKALSIYDRAKRSVALIEAVDPDVIFFTSQEVKTYNEIKKALKGRYRFIMPMKYEPSWLAYAGVVAAIKKNQLRYSVDRNEYVKKAGQWLAIEIGGASYLGVHAPKPTDRTYEDFMTAIQKYTVENKPVVVCGDFNPLIGDKIHLTGYQDYLPLDVATTVNDVKADYAFGFVSGTEITYTANIMPTAMASGATLISDHAATLISFEWNV